MFTQHSLTIISYTASTLKERRVRFRNIVKIYKVLKLESGVTLKSVWTQKSLLSLRSTRLPLLPRKEYWLWTRDAVLSPTWASLDLWMTLWPTCSFPSRPLLTCSSMNLAVFSSSSRSCFFFFSSSSCRRIVSGSRSMYWIYQPFGVSSTLQRPLKKNQTL